MPRPWSAYDGPVTTSTRIETVVVRSRQRTEAIEVTNQIVSLVRETGITRGLCQIYIPHTTAGIFINENADPDVLHDLLATLERLVPWEHTYRHAEGNAAAHIRSTLVGTSQSLPIQNSRLALGRWQGIFVAEFDGPRERQLQVTILGGGK